MIDLTAKPFYLDGEGCRWVEDTLASLSTEEKVGQLFCEVLWENAGEEPEELLAGMQPGAVMYRPLSGQKALRVTRWLQGKAKVPMLIASNLERGGSGGNNAGLTDGTYVSSPMGAAATGQPSAAYRLGLVAAREAAAAGVNWSFCPIIDIDYNAENPITNVRTFGSDPDTVIAMAKAYTDAMRENAVAVTIKHFPGDGVDFRDQHLLTSVNSLSAEDWYASYGRVYQALIDHGAQAVMSAHIMQPALSRALVPGIADADLLPASLSRELNGGVLRDRLGFNGVIVTDATQMTGFNCAMPREKAVPASIAAGVDMFLFTINQREDMRHMMAGVENGTISLRRLDEAVTRILALKASIGLHGKRALPEEGGLEAIGCPEHRRWAREVADESVTLVKDTQGLLPLSPGKTPRVLVHIITNENVPQGGVLPEAEHFLELLQKEGFSAQLQRDQPYPGAGISVEEYRNQWDLIIYFVNMKVGSNQTSLRISWGGAHGGDSPKYVQEIPTLFLSMSNPYHLVDVPMIRSYVNAYTCNNTTVEAVMEKLMGRSEFKGKNPVDPFVELWDARR